MRVAYLTAGAAGMYCGSCLHDNTLARAIQQQGEELLLVPTYTPIRTDEQDVSLRRVFFGGVNVFLQQKWSLFRHTPRWLDRWFDQRWFLELVSKRSGSVDPAKLGDLTVSMLQGEQGHQRKELDKLVDWLVEDVQPDIVHLSNSMLLGMARQIRQRCGSPVICALSGEDFFLERLAPPHYERARTLLRERAAEVESFTSLNSFYANFMADYLTVPRERIHVIPHGLDLAEFPSDLNATVRGAEPPTIGYFARICPEKGLHLLVEACARLAENYPDLPFRVQAAGYLGPADKPYLARLTRLAAQGALAGRFNYLGELGRAEKIRFLQSLTLFSTPTIHLESKGLPAIEALASGVPVVLPDHGAFPELIAQTSGGLLFQAGEADRLAHRLLELLRNGPRRARLRHAGYRAVRECHTDVRMAERTLDLYRKTRSGAATSR